jgi:subtilisin-like proprotein convertase family protein
MNHLELTTMAMTLERERRLQPDLLERERRIQEHLGPGRSGKAGALGLARHNDAGMWHRVRQWLALPWDTPAPRVSAAAIRQLGVAPKETRMRSTPVPTRIALVALAALLALPAISTDPPVAAKGRQRTVTRTFRGLPVELITTSTNSPVSASTGYPTQITVDGLKGKIRDVNVRITNLDHALPDDLELLLVGPEGQTAIVLADVGGTTLITDVTLRLDDEAATLLPDASTLQSGSFRPTNATGAAISFNDPAPSANASAALSVFDGTDPNGTWRLFAQDDDAPTGIGFFDSWALEITAKAKKRKR